MKGPFLSPKDQETALFLKPNENKKKLNRNSIKHLLKKHGFQSGISLLEALIALALLAFVLLTSVAVRFTTSKADLARVDELSAAAILRESCMEYQAGMITNAFEDTNTTNMSESGGRYVLYGKIHTNDLLKIQRMDFQIAVTDNVGNTKVSAYRARWKYLAPARVDFGEALDMNTTPSKQVLHVFSTNTARGVFRIEGPGVSTNTTNDMTITNVYGTTYTLVAVPAVGSIFSMWKCSDNRLTNINSATNTGVILDGDREIEAVFAAP